MSKKKNKERRYRISNEVATQLGLELNPERRYRLSEELEQEYLNIQSDPNFDNLTQTQTNQYPTGKSILSAVKPNGQIMTIREYCDFYGIDYSHAKSYKLVTHTGNVYYNIASNNLDENDDIPFEDIMESISSGLEGIVVKDVSTSNTGSGTIVATLADLHFGAYIQGLIKTRDFSISILAEKLQECARLINRHGASIVHVHILGDLIESFTGLNHRNSWKGLQKGMIGAEAVKLCCKLLHEHFFSQITNLGDIKIIAGNHDRVTSDNKEDTDGEAANLIAWGLELIGYRVEFNPFIITHVVDGISYILLHGHDSISKKSTKDICWDYGKQNMFNLITEGHLHSIIEKLSVNQRRNFQTIKDDAIDHRRMSCPSLFTGNSFSERLGYTSNSGFVVTENNGNGIPNVFYYAV